MAAGAGGMSGRVKTAAAVGQFVAVAGMVICVALIIGVLLGRGWAVNEVDKVSAKLDSGVARAADMFDAASTKVADVSTKIGTVADAAAAIGTGSTPVLDKLTGLQTTVTAVSDKYLALRASYADMRSQVQSVIDQLNVVSRFVPGVSVPQGPVDALAALDGRLQELDTTVMALIDANPLAGAAGSVGQAVSDKAHAVQATLATVSSALNGVQARLTSLRTEIASTADTIRAAINVISLIVIVALLYLVALHVVLLRSSRGLTRKPAGA
jgi:predicted RND superfamily exporter protein